MSRTLWGLVKNAHMTIKPPLITEQFSSAILYSADTASSTLLWVQPAGKGSPLTTTGEPGRPPGRLLPPRPAPAAPATVALLWTSDLSSGLCRVLCKLSLSLPLQPCIPTTDKEILELPLMFKGNTTEQPTITFCVRRRDICASGKGGSVPQQPI